MKKFTVVLRWNDAKQRWDCILKATGRFVMDFPDCDNMHLLSDGLSRDRDNERHITVRHIIEGGR